MQGKADAQAQTVPETAPGGKGSKGSVVISGGITTLSQSSVIAKLSPSERQARDRSDCPSSSPAFCAWGLCSLLSGTPLSLHSSALTCSLMCLHRFWIRTRGCRPRIMHQNSFPALFDAGMPSVSLAMGTQRMSRGSSSRSASPS